MGNKEDSVFLAKYSAFSPYRLFRREVGFAPPLGAGDALARSLYCGMKPIASWSSEYANALPTGGVFNLEFSPDGSLLVAACEKKSIQIFDSLTHQRIHTVNGAHSDCVNCVKFLDGRMFATCSDDTTIALWDVRNLKKKICSLLGHSNWVKNIEFSMKDKLLVTSGLDGSIYTWDINSYSECNLVYQRVFHASGLMRCRLSPNARQMVMCTTRGLLVIVHDLNLTTLAADLHGFKPNLYRLMQTSNQLIPIAAQYDHLFDQKRGENRIEFISDFPEGNDAEVVSALQIHPLGWSALSRNISHDDKSEWSCIHDIQPVECSSDKSVRDPAPVAAAVPARRTRRPPRRPRPRPRPYCQPRPQATVTPALPEQPPPTHQPYLNNREYIQGCSADKSVRGPAPVAAAVPARPQATVTPALPEQPGTSAHSRRAWADSRAPPAVPPAARLPAPRLGGNDVWEASITIKQHRMLQELTSRGQGHRNFNMQRIMGINTGIAPPAARARPRPRPDEQEESSTTPSTSGRTPRTPPEDDDADEPSESESTKHYIRQNRDRLLYYVEETNEGKGFIKELCYSADGRLVCSPFGCGMRLLALNERCGELSHCVEGFTGPRPMVDVGQSLGHHQDLVVSCKFSPRYHLLVTGCLEGKIVWYEPFSGETLY